MTWLAYGIFAAISFGFYNFYTKLSSNKFSPTIALLFLTGTSFSIALLATIFFKITGRPLVFSRDHIYLPVLAGIATGAAEIFYLFMFSKAAPLGAGTTIVVGGSFAVAVLLGVFFLKEQIDILKIVGFVSVILGIFLLSK
jgi:uncharacterized membrane protein